VARRNAILNHRLGRYAGIENEEFVVGDKSDIPATFAWFEKRGWTKCWEWGTPPTFAAVGSGESEIFLCQGGQGGHGRGVNTATFGEGGSTVADKGVWMSVWVDDVDAVYRKCQAAGVEVTFSPTDMP
jgi:hypothetical protein